MSSTSAGPLLTTICQDSSPVLGTWQMLSKYCLSQWTNVFTYCLLHSTPSLCVFYHLFPPGFLFSPCCPLHPKPQLWECTLIMWDYLPTKAQGSPFQEGLYLHSALQKVKVLVTQSRSTFCIYECIFIHMTWLALFFKIFLAMKHWPTYLRATGQKQAFHFSF